MTRLCGVQRDQLDTAWPQVFDLIDAAIKYGTSRLTAQDVYHGLSEGRFQLWIAWDDDEIKGLAVTETVKTARGLMASVFICTGKDRKEWFDHLDTIEAWARSKGCVLFSNRARYGWKKQLTAKGYRPAHIQMVKKL